MSSSLLNFQATKSGHDNSRSALGARRSAFGVRRSAFGGDGPTIPSGPPCRWTNDSGTTAGVSPSTRGVYWQVSAIPQILSLIDVTHHCIIFILPIKMLFGFSPAQPKKITARYFALTFGVRRSAFGVRCSAFGARRSAFGVRRSALGVRRSAFGVRRSALGARRGWTNHPVRPSLPMDQ